MSKTDNAAILVCCMGYSDERYGLTGRLGERVRASCEAARRHPLFYVEDGLSTAELRGELQRRFPDMPMLLPGA